MKKIISISILTAYLCVSTEFIQLLKIPLLVEHFIEHKTENKDITFKDFFIIHYLEKQHVDGDYEKDMRLPFKTINTSVTSIVHSIPSLLSSLSRNHDNREGIEFNPYEDLFIDNVFISSIWQPPRFY